MTPTLASEPMMRIAGHRDGPAADPAEPRPHRPGDPGERRPAVGVDPVERGERRRDEQHRHERGQQHAGCVDPGERDERARGSPPASRPATSRPARSPGRRGSRWHPAGGSAPRRGRTAGSCRVRAHATVIAAPGAERQGFRWFQHLVTATESSSARVTANSSEVGMRILLVGAGGVGGAITAIAARRTFVERLVVADYDPARAEKAVAAAGDPRFVAARVDASDEAAVARAAGRAPLRRAAQRHRPAVRDAAVPGGAGRRRRTTSTWRCRCPSPHPERPYEETGVKLGDEQFALAGEWEAAGPAGAGRHRRRARAVRRLRPLRRRPPVRRDRRARRPRRRRT